MKRWRLNTRAFHNNRIHEPGEIIELEDDVAPPSKAQFIPGKGQAIEDVPMADLVWLDEKVPPQPASPEQSGSVGAPAAPAETPAAAPPSDPAFVPSAADLLVTHDTLPAHEPLVPRFEPGELIPSAPEKEVVAEETPPRPL